MNDKIDRLMDIHDRLYELWNLRHEAERERDKLVRERSMLLMSMDFEQREAYDLALAARSAAKIQAAADAAARAGVIL